MFSRDELLSDLSAFADDDDDILLEADGSFALTRGDRTIVGKFVASADGRVDVVVDDERISYRKFITSHVARLEVLAERLLTKRTTSANFVDGRARLDANARGVDDARSYELLASECQDLSPVATRVVFLTADAGHGKTFLLREFQRRQAEAFLAGSSDFLVWHVDLQGRQLVRLSEALMGDLGELRVPGLWMSAVIRLMRHKAVVLAIDGFDELAAEQGSTDALGALANLVRQLEGQGVVIAASRRTFFDTEDYVARARLLSRAVTSPTEFDQLSLLPWHRDDCIAYLEAEASEGRSVGDAVTTYEQILNELGGDGDHPMLCRPFLFSRVVRGLSVYGLSPAEFMRGMDDPLQGVAAVVEAFVRREVSDKWKYADTGEPYLSFEQHMDLLAAVADEMYRSQRDRLPVDVIETIAAILFEQWTIDAQRRQQVMHMVRMHVLLTIPPDGDSDSRSFDHSEFRDYFVAYSLREQLRDLALGAGNGDLPRLLSIAQISDATARYVCSMLDLNDEAVGGLVERLAHLARDEWKPTYLQSNAGTLISFLIDSREFAGGLSIDAPLIISSLALENSQLNNVTFRNVTLIRLSIGDATWTNVLFERCQLGELGLGPGCTFSGVTIRECDIDGLVLSGEEETVREYAPSRIRTALADRGVMFDDGPPQLELSEVVADSDLTKLVRRFLRLFHRSTIVTGDAIDRRFRSDPSRVWADVVPLLTQFGVIEERKWHGAGVQRVWALTCQLDQLLSAEDPSASPSTFRDFWHAVADR